MYDWGGIVPKFDLNTIVAEAITYEVQPGDDLWKISEDNYRLGEPYKWIAAATYRYYDKVLGETPIDIVNNGINPGDILVIPQHWKYSMRIRLVNEGESLWDLACAEYGWGEVYTQILEWNNWWANTYYTAFFEGAAGSYRMQNIEQISLEAHAPLCLLETDYFDWKVSEGETAESLAERIYGNSELAYVIRQANADEGREITAGKWIIIPIKDKTLYNSYAKYGTTEASNVITGSGYEYADSGFSSNASITDSTPYWGVGISNDPTTGINGTAMQKLLMSNNIYTRTQINDRYDKFNRFGYLDPYNAITQTREYLFFTRPDLHLYQDRNPDLINPELARYSFFRDAIERYPYVTRSLEQRVENNFPLIPLLSNTVSSSLDLPDASADEMETMTNIYGTKETYRGSSYKSDEQHQFSLEFTDTKFLEVYMFFKVYDEYEKLKKMGKVSLPDINYAYRKILHDMFAIFKFIVDEDGETILYWGKTYGTYPLSVPRGAISDLSDNARLKYTVDFKCLFVEDMDPQILVDFNTLMKPYYNTMTEMPLFDRTAMHPDGEWAGIPYVAYNNTANNEYPSLKGMRKKYMLKWRK